MHVLIVDDVAANRRLPEVVLRRAGIPVTSVDSGAAALDAIAHGDFSVVLLDLNMPEMSGIDVCHSLRRQYSPDQLKLVAYTAFVTEEDRTHLQSLGFDDLLVKPVTPRAILTAVGSMTDSDSVSVLPAASGEPLPDHPAR
ncbi:response regulator [Nitrogeniibacter aestuarii]|uniref:response regulator n=1 Tax=Nitrogeniibacter aestuarii TaxID=2815343 RepID=UPI001D101F49|nr:response regulator [Nitrogeniibacter aestuarii]